jgi:L-gulono-1,4-lactone dehydrogenase
MSSCIRVALVGCGWFARVAHIPALQRLEREGRIRLVALCSRTEESVARASGMYGRTNIKRCRSLEEVAEDPDVDLVDLLLPIETMPFVIKLFLAAGKHVISEKPCAPSVASGVELLEFYGRIERPPLWAVAENWRFKKTVKIVESIVSNGTIGEIQFADFTYLDFQGPNNLGWRGSPKYEGGFLLDSGVHFVAMLRKVVGEVEKVRASVSQRLPYLPPADSITAILSFVGGAEGAYRLSFAAPSAIGDQGLRLTGTKGTLLAGFHRFSKRDIRHNWIRVQTGAGRRFIPVTDDLWVPGGVYETLSHCVDAVQYGAPLSSTAAEGLRDVAVVEAMLESDRLERPGKPAPILAPIHGRAQTLNTYGNVLSCSPRHVVECGALMDVTAAVAAATRSGSKVRVFGNGYSYGTEILTDDVSIRLNSLNRIRHLDPVKKRVVAEAGVRLGDLHRVLAGAGLSFPSLPFLTHASIGGAVATAMHGTSARWGTISDFVQSLTMVVASGEVKKIDRDDTPEEMRAASVAVGSLGVIVELELQAISMPWVRFEELSTTVDDFLLKMPTLAQRYEHLWGHWRLGTDIIDLKCLETRAAAEKGFRPYVDGEHPFWGEENWKSANIGRAKSVLRRMARFHPALAGAAKRAKAKALARQRVGVSMQYGVAASQAHSAMELLRSSEFSRSNPGRVLELKFLKGSNQSYLGPNANRDAILFNTWWFVDEAVKLKVFDSFEDVMRRLGGRPHWGKLHKRPDVKYMRTAYPGWDSFEAIRARFDPNQTFAIY